MLKIYTYSQCDTCRKAVKFLRAKGIPFNEKPIRETPPSTAELKEMLAALGEEKRKLFNTSGRDYKAMELGAKMDSLSDADAIKLLAANGNLVKRPFVLGDEVKLVGFNEAAWEKTFG
jgi:arsenate reductase